LQSHPQVLKAAWEAINQFGISTATSRGGYGENVIYDDLENEAAFILERRKFCILPAVIWVWLSLLKQAEKRTTIILLTPRHISTYGMQQRQQPCHYGFSPFAGRESGRNHK